MRITQPRPGAYRFLAQLLLALVAGAFTIGLTAGAGMAGVDAQQRTPTPTRRPKPTATTTATPIASPTPGGSGGGYTVTAIGIQANGINAGGQVVGYASGGAFLWSPSLPNGTSGSLVSLGTLGGAISLAEGINASGQATGYSTLSGGAYRAFLYSGGALFNLGTLGASYSSGYGLNDLGQVAGSSYISGGESSSEHAFLWTPSTANGTSGSMVDLGTLGGDYSTAHAVNQAGQVVGYAYRADGNFHAFLYTAGAMSDLGTLGGSYSQADDINNVGQIVGQAYLPGNVNAHAFLWQSGTMTDLGALGSHYSDALAINSDGSQIVGEADIPNNTGYLVYHAFLYRNGRLQDLNSLLPAHSGWELTTAASINDAGQIVGSGTLNGQPAGFLLTPR